MSAWVGRARSVSKAVKGFLLTLAGLCLFAVGCDNPPVPDTSNYKAQIEKARAVKDAAFEAKCCSDAAPIPDDKKKDYLPLLYYPIDDSYNVPAVLTPSTDKTVLQMQTSSGQPRAERRAGTLTFTLHGQQMTLTAFVEADAPNMNRLFVPFSDTTSGDQTYGGGRFMDLDVTPTGIYDVDFNRAYTPYCYYNATFECPYPPAENRLKIPIAAGERIRSHS